MGVILNQQDEVLLTRRPNDSHQGGLWEFPGGKCEVDETIDGALRRELREELGIEVLEYSPLLTISHDYGDKQVLLDVNLVRGFSGEPRGCEGQPMRWVPRAALATYAFPAANAAIVEALTAPPVGRRP